MTPTQAAWVREAVIRRPTGVTGHHVGGTCDPATTRVCYCCRTDAHDDCEHGTPLVEGWVYRPGWNPVVDHRAGGDICRVWYPDRTCRLVCPCEVCRPTAPDAEADQPALF